MERLSSGSALPDRLRGAFVALGNFDGFHLGHQAVVGRAVERARAAGGPAIVATFDPHPMRYFRPDSAYFRLTSLDQRAALFAAAGVDAMYVFEFDAALAALSAEAFVTERLVGDLGVQLAALLRIPLRLQVGEQVLPAHPAAPSNCPAPWAVRLSASLARS